MRKGEGDWIRGREKGGRGGGEDLFTQSPHIPKFGPVL